MPNNVTNEIIFRNITPDQRKSILEKVLNKKGEIDFEVLVPSPINLWNGEVSTLHERAFRQTHLDWASQNWGTKWNAYGQGPIDVTENILTLVFDTAWRPPYGWIVALFNTFMLPFEHNWMYEGDDKVLCGKFDPKYMTCLGGGNAWEENEAGEEEQIRFRKSTRGF